MAAQKLNLLHILLLLSAGACFYYVLWENRQRTIAFRKHFRSSWFAIGAVLLLVFFRVGMKQPVWPIGSALAAGIVVGGIYGFTLKLRVDRSWSIPRPPGGRYMAWLAGLLLVAVAVEIAGAVIGPEARMWRFYTTLVALGCAGALVGRSIAIAFRVWRLVG